jgi:hypothetical protein
VSPIAEICKFWITLSNLVELDTLTCCYSLRLSVEDGRGSEKKVHTFIEPILVRETSNNGHENWSHP